MSKKKAHIHVTPESIKEQEEFKNPPVDIQDHVELEEPLLHSAGLGKFGRYWRAFSLTTKGDKVISVEYGPDGPRASAQTDLKIRIVRAWDKTLKELEES